MTTATPASTNRISSYILFVTVAAVPFTSGSTEPAPAAIAFWCIVLGLGAIFVSLQRLRREHLPLVGMALIVTMSYAFVLHEQLAARPWIASPQPLWQEAAKTLGILIEPSVSIARHQPFLALGAPLANMLALICSFIVCIDRARAHQLLQVIAWSGAAYVVYGIAVYLIGPPHIQLSSTFSNRNTAAVYFGLCAVLWLLFSMQHLRRHLPLYSVYLKSAPSLLLSEMPILSFIMFFICLTALVMTQSRAGTVLSFMACVLAFIAFFYRDLRRRRRSATALLIGGLTFLAVLATLGVLGANFMYTLEAAGFRLDQGRLDTYRSMLRIIADHPWFGTGLGTFVWSFPAYRHGDIFGIWTYAHSTPLELAGDLGLPLTGLIGLAWLVVLVVLTRGVFTRRSDRIVPASALAVAILSLTHSFIDFSFQIPGYAVVVFALVGAGLAQSFSSNNQTRISPAQSLTSPRAELQITQTIRV